MSDAARVLRVLVVEGDVATRIRVVRALAADPTVEVVGAVGGPADAFALCDRLCPDAVTLAPRLASGTSLQLVQDIMAARPTPILVVPAPRERTEPAVLVALLQAGAVEVLRPPVTPEPERAWDGRLVAAVRAVGRIRVITHPRGPRPRPPAPGPDPASSRLRVVALGASTGGPAAVSELLRMLPPGFPLPILLVIHVGLTFGRSLARWLDELSPVRVSLAKDGDPLPSLGEGGVLLAPPDRHLTVAAGKVCLTYDPPRHSCRPSVDVLFESVAREYGRSSVGGLLTGMGRDGAAGLLALRQAGAATFAQDEASSAVFGMPREAATLGAAQRILAPTGIGREISALGATARRP